MQASPISNEAISDVVWSALELSDRDKGGTTVTVNLYESGSATIKMCLVRKDQAPEIRLYSINDEEGAKSALEMITETKERGITEDKDAKPPVKMRIKSWLWYHFMLVMARIDHKRDARRKEREEWILLKREDRLLQKG